MHHLSTLPGRGGTHRGPRHRVERFSQRRNARGLRSPRRHGPPVYPLYLGHDRRAQGRGAGQRRPSRGAQVVDAKRVRRVAGRGVLGGVRRRLGGGAFLHHLCAAHSWLHHHPLRGQARRHAGCGRFLAHHLRARGEGFLHRAHGVPRHQARRSGRRSHEELRPQSFPHPVPGGRTLGLGHDSVGGRTSEGSRHRPLLADRERLADAGEFHGHRAYARQVRLPLEGGARL